MPSDRAVELAFPLVSSQYRFLSGLLYSFLPSYALSLCRIYARAIHVVYHSKPDVPRRSPASPATHSAARSSFCCCRMVSPTRVRHSHAVRKLSGDCGNSSNNSNEFCEGRDKGITKSRVSVSTAGDTACVCRECKIRRDRVSVGVEEWRQRPGPKEGRRKSRGKVPKADRSDHERGVMPCCVAKRNLERLRKSDEPEFAFFSFPLVFAAFSCALLTDDDDTDDALDEVAPL